MAKCISAPAPGQVSSGMCVRRGNDRCALLRVFFFCFPPGLPETFPPHECPFWGATQHPTKGNLLGASWHRKSAPLRFLRNSWRHMIFRFSPLACAHVLQVPSSFLFGSLCCCCCWKTHHFLTIFTHPPSLHPLHPPPWFLRVLYPVV